MPVKKKATPRRLTTRAAWDYLADVYARNAEKPFAVSELEPGFFYPKIGSIGLCGALRRLREEGRITPKQRGAMQGTVGRTLHEASQPFRLARYNMDGAALRSMLCTLFALEPDA